MKTLKLITALCILYFAFCISSNAQQTFTQFDTTYTPSGYPEGPLLGVLYVPSNPNGCGVVLGHTSGPGGDRNQLHVWGETLASLGYVVLSVDYYQLWNVQGVPSLYPAPPRAFKTAVEFLRRNAFRFGCYTSKIAGIGASEGARNFGQMIIWDNDDSFFQTNPNINDHLDAVALYYHMYDNENFLHSYVNLHQITKDYFANNHLIEETKGNPIVNISNITTPVLLQTGTEDIYVQWQQSQQFYDSLIAHGKNAELILYPGQDHLFDYPFINGGWTFNSFTPLGLISRDTTIAFLQRNMNPYSNKCAQTKTYWKNNLAQWSVYALPMMLGTSNYYNSSQLISMLNTSPGNDMSRKLAQQLISAKLNAMNGVNALQVLSAITASDNLIGTRTIPIVPKITMSSAEGQQMNSLANMLESFNNGSFNSNCNARLSANPDNNATAINSFEVYPNPVSNSTTISFSLSKSQKVSLKIFDVSGRLVSTLADKIFEAGENELVWNASEVNAGVYFLRMETASYSENRKLIVAK